jgi:hypothetical protein
MLDYNKLPFNERLFLFSEFHTERVMRLKQMVMINQQITPSAILSELDALFLYSIIYFCNYITYQFILFGNANILHVQLSFKTHQKVLFHYKIYDIDILIYQS